MAKEGSAENTIRDIKRKTRRKHSAEEKIRIVIEGLRGEDTIAELCRREGIAQSLYYKMEGNQGCSGISGSRQEPVGG
jgi:transposase